MDSDSQLYLAELMAINDELKKRTQNTEKT